MLGVDDDVDDFRYVWHGPAGAESWWPARPMEHVVIYARTLVPATVVGILWGLAFGWSFLSRAVPMVAFPLLTWALVDGLVRHVDALRPLSYHRSVLRGELTAPRPVRPGAAVVVRTSTPLELLGTAPSVTQLRHAR
jgi:hypothetical protein